VLLLPCLEGWQLKQLLVFLSMLTCSNQRALYETAGACAVLWCRKSWLMLLNVWGAAVSLKTAQTWWALRNSRIQQLVRCS